MDSVAFCSPAKSLNFSGLIRKPISWQKVKVLTSKQNAPKWNEEPPAPTGGFPKLDSHILSSKLLSFRRRSREAVLGHNCKAKIVQIPKVKIKMTSKEGLSREANMKLIAGAPF